MAAKLELTETERRARRAEQSRQSRAKKAGTDGVSVAPDAPKAPKAGKPTPAALDVAGLLAAAALDLASYYPKNITASKPAAIDKDDEMVVLQIDNVVDLDKRLGSITNDFKQWAEQFDWRKELRMSVAELNTPGAKLPSVQFYVVAD